MIQVSLPETEETGFGEFRRKVLVGGSTFRIHAAIIAIDSL